MFGAYRVKALGLIDCPLGAAWDEPWNAHSLKGFNPYATTHVTRPFDKGKYQPDEHPFIGLDRMIHGIGTVKKAVPTLMGRFSFGLTALTIPPPEFIMKPI